MMNKKSLKYIDFSGQYDKFKLMNMSMMTTGRVGKGNQLLLHFSHYGKQCGTCCEWCTFIIAMMRLKQESPACTIVLVLLQRQGRSDSYATEFDLEAEEYVPLPKGDVHKKKEVIQDVTLHDLDIANARPQVREK